MAKAITEEPVGAPLPKVIQITGPYGFLDDDDQLHMWQPGIDITDPADIALLVSNQVEHLDIG